MRRIKKWLNPAADVVVDLDCQFDQLERSFEEELTKTYGLAEQKKLRTEFRTNELTGNQTHDSNKIVEIFILAALILFSALEEADWLCLSAQTKTLDVIQDESSWSIYKILPFSLTFK